jgi:hypothetical protein
MSYIRYGWVANNAGKLDPLWPAEPWFVYKRGVDDVIHRWKCNRATEEMQHKHTFNSKKLAYPSYQFFAVVAEGCLSCLYRNLEMDPSCLQYESDTNKYNAMDWAIYAQCERPTKERGIVIATMSDRGCRPNHYKWKALDPPRDARTTHERARGSQDATVEWEEQEDTWNSEWSQPSSWQERAWHGLDPRHGCIEACNWQSTWWQRNQWKAG